MSSAVLDAPRDRMGGGKHQLVEPIGYLPPVEFEEQDYRNRPPLAVAAGVN